MVLLMLHFQERAIYVSTPLYDQHIDNVARAEGLHFSAFHCMQLRKYIQSILLPFNCFRIFRNSQFTIQTL